MPLRPSLWAGLARPKSWWRRYEADTLSDVTFVGRLATCKVDTIDQVVAQSLATFKRLSSLAA